MSTGFYFGQRWDAPAFDDAQEVAAPLGTICPLCEEPIVEGDSGTLQSFMGEHTAPYVAGVHIECWLRQGLGSPAHMRGECACTGNPEPEDDRTWREQGREVMSLVHEMRKHARARWS